MLCGCFEQCREWLEVEGEKAQIELSSFTCWIIEVLVANPAMDFVCIATFLKKI